MESKLYSKQTLNDVKEKRKAFGDIHNKIG